jgi:hypothetical protein
VAVSAVCFVDFLPIFQKIRPALAQRHIGCRQKHHQEYFHPSFQVAPQKSAKGLSQKNDL